MGNSTHSNMLWMPFLMFILLAGLLAACGTTSSLGTGSTGGSTTTPSSPSPSSTAASPTATSGSVLNGHGCAGQATLSAVRMLNASNGWALSADAILKTSDGGVHWNCVTPKDFAYHIGMDARGAFLSDNLHAWVVPATSSNNTVTILRTSHGGQTWQSSTLTASQPEVGDAPHFINTQEGWIELVTNGGPGAGSESVDIFHTSDGGQTWSRIASTDDPNSGLPRGGLKSGISFKDSLNGWATGEDASDTPWLYVTHDGGKTWGKQGLRDLPGAIGTQFTTVHYATTPPVFFGNTGLLPVEVVGQLDQGPQAAVHGFMLYTSTDGGQSWATTWKANSGTLTTFQATLQGLYIEDPQHAWAGNNQDRSLYGTNDGGQTWHKLADNVGQIVSMSFVDASNGWIVSNNGLLRTTDGGRTWQRVNYIYP
jgi:photosystem II stability/assembly factor-like uncharacterized protein